MPKNAVQTRSGRVEVKDGFDGGKGKVEVGTEQTKIVFSLWQPNRIELKQSKPTVWTKLLG